MVHTHINVCRLLATRLPSLTVTGRSNVRTSPISALLTPSGPTVRCLSSITGKYAVTSPKSTILSSRSAHCYTSPSPRPEFRRPFKHTFLPPQRRQSYAGPLPRFCRHPRTPSRCGGERRGWSRLAGRRRDNFRRRRGAYVRLPSASHRTNRLRQISLVLWLDATGGGQWKTHRPHAQPAKTCDVHANVAKYHRHRSDKRRPPLCALQGFPPHRHCKNAPLSITLNQLSWISSM